MDISSPATVESPTADHHSENPAEASALDLLRSLQNGGANARFLSSFQRILLTTDGTVTDILAAHLWERIQIRKLYEKIVEVDGEVEHLDLAGVSKLIVRRVVLQGKTTKNNYTFAHSITVPDRLSPKMRKDLIRTRKPIGLLMNEERLETFREILEIHIEKAGEVGQYFSLSKEALLISRTYRVMSHGKPIMLITEKFPQNYFRD